MGYFNTVIGPDAKAPEDADYNVVVGIGHFAPTFDRHRNLVFMVDGEERFRVTESGQVYINQKPVCNVEDAGEELAQTLRELVRAVTAMYH